MDLDAYLVLPNRHKSFTVLPKYMTTPFLKGSASDALTPTCSKVGGDKLSRITCPSLK